MLRAAALFVFVLAAAACGQTAGVANRPAGGTPTTRVTLYFLAEDGTISLGVRRDVVERVPPPWGSVAGGALEALVAGPTDEERGRGFTSAIPEGATLRSLRSRGPGGTGAVVEFAGLDGLDDGLERARVITQIVRTLVGVSYGSVERVWLRADGRPWGMYLMSGGVDDGPFDYDTLAGFHLGAACPGTETVVCDRFDALP